MLADDKNNSMPETVFVKEGIIEFTGSFAELQSLYSKKELNNLERIDLKNRALFPGFWDSHTHFVMSAEKLSTLDLTGLNLEKIVTAIEKKAKTLMPDEWITGHGWDLEALFKTLDPGHVKRVVNCLNSACINPVYLISKDAHGSLLNQRALRMALALESLPEKCKLHKCSNKFSGLVFEQVFDLKDMLIPPLSKQAMQELLKKMGQSFFSKGITSVQTNEKPNEFFLLRDFHKKQLEKQINSACIAPCLPKMICNLIFSDTDELKKNIKIFNQKPGFNSFLPESQLKTINNWFVPGGVKLFMDGSLGSRTAAMTLPYKGTENNRGILVISEKELENWLIALQKHNLYGVFHSIGDRASSILLAMLKKFSSYLNKNRFHQIEHFQFLNQNILKTYDFSNLIIGAQPSHLWHDDALVKQYLARSVQKFSYSYKSMAEKGARLCFGSDSPVETIDPWSGIAAAVSRINHTHNPKQALDLYQAIACHTLNPSAQLNNPFNCGTIEKGRSADLAIFNHNPFDMLKSDEKSLANSINCDLTFINGKCVFG